MSPKDQAEREVILAIDVLTSAIQYALDNPPDAAMSWGGCEGAEQRLIVKKYVDYGLELHLAYAKMLHGNFVKQYGVITYAEHTKLLEEAEKRIKGAKVVK